MNKVQRSIVLAAAALVGLPLAVARCNVHGSSPDLDQYDHPVEAGEEASATEEAATGDDAAASDDAAAQSSSDSGDKGDSAKDGGDAGQGGDAGDASEEPPGCSVPSGGTACTPHAVACSSTSCTTPTDVCCATSFSGGVPTGTCTAAATGCLGTTDVACEEAADCASGVCCETPAALGAPGTQTCESSCIGGYQICRSDTECTTGTCTPQSCPYVGGTYDIEACGLQPNCTATN
jgi:hypothetical protein